MFQVFARSSVSKVDSEQRRRVTLDNEGSGHEVRHVHITILGSGFSGLGMAIRLKQRGEQDFVILEKASDLGGTWRDNTYPGCACDIPSHLYSFSFALNPGWSRAFSSQHEIQIYLRRCARRYGIFPHIQWDSELLDAMWKEDEQCWHLKTARGELRTDILIMGQGPLSEPSLPAISGIESFAGELFHSAQWRHEYDLSGKRVAVIGTGASAIQFVPLIQPKVGHLSLFQRTPPWILPRLDRAIPAWQQRLYRILPFTQHAVRTKMYWQRELTALGMVYRPSMLESAMQIANHYREKRIADPELRAKLIPKYTLGCKRVLLSDDFYPALTQPNVEVITDSIREVRAHSIVIEDGSEHEVDAIICATGFHVTNTHIAQYIHGRDGRSLAESWQAGPHAYYGTTVSGFPNLFLLIGPNTGLGHNSMVFMIESQLRYILDGLHLMERKNIRVLEVRADEEERFNVEMQKRMQGTVWMSGCSSWYLDARGHNTTLWPGFTFEYRYRMRKFDPQKYQLIAQKDSHQLSPREK
jgi:cation diffusion facilitator CzcD-associated flavoprotein CzcO